MKLYSFLALSCVLYFFSPATMPTAYAQNQTTTAGSEQIKAMLLKPAGWIVEVHGTKRTRLMDYKFDAVEEKVIVVIQAPDGTRGCKRDVTIAADTVRFDGCSDQSIQLRFDPDDREYPFKGKGALGYQYKFKAK